MGSITPEQNIEATMIVSLYNNKAQELSQPVPSLPNSPSFPARPSAEALG